MVPIFDVSWRAAEQVTSLYHLLPLITHMTCLQQLWISGKSCLLFIERVQVWLLPVKLGTEKLIQNIPFYRPQTWFAKVMFLHLSVNLSTEGVFLPQCMLGYTPPGRHPPAQCMLGYTVPSACWDRHGYCCGWYASYWNAFFLPPATKLGQGNIFRSVCQGGGMHGRGGMRGRGCAWQEACMVGMHAWQGGHAWRGGGVRGRYYKIWSMSARYASYWNAFFLYTVCGQVVSKIHLPALVLIIC